MNNLLKFRKDMNLTQNEIADKVDVSLSYYQKIELGFKQPSYNFINKFIKAFPEVEVSIFFENQSH